MNTLMHRESFGQRGRAYAIAPLGIRLNRTSGLFQESTVSAAFVKRDCRMEHGALSVKVTRCYRAHPLASRFPTGRGLLRGLSRLRCSCQGSVSLTHIKSHSCGICPSCRNLYQQKCISRTPENAGHSVQLGADHWISHAASDLKIGTPTKVLRDSFRYRAKYRSPSDGYPLQGVA
jgi:hypothetical protein